MLYTYVCRLSQNVSTVLVLPSSLETIVPPPMRCRNHTPTREERLEQLVQHMGDSCVKKRCLRRLAKQVVVNR